MKIRYQQKSIHFQSGPTRDGQGRSVRNLDTIRFIRWLEINGYYFISRSVSNSHVVAEFLDAEDVFEIKLRLGSGSDVNSTIEKELENAL